MREAFAVAGAVAIGAAWWWVAAGRSGALRVLPVVLGVLGIGSIAIIGSDLSLGSAASLAAGAASGLALYGATLVFVGLASRWEPFRRDVAESYAEADAQPLVPRLVLALAISVPGEELFFRGLIQLLLLASIAPGAAAAVTAAVEVATNLPSRRLSIVAAAIVGGALWSGLAWWSGGILSPMASHLVWTGLMLVRPPAISGR